MEIKQLCIQLTDRTAVHYVGEERRKERKTKQKGQVGGHDSKLMVSFISECFSNNFKIRLD